MGKKIKLVGYETEVLWLTANLLCFKLYNNEYYDMITYFYVIFPLLLYFVYKSILSVIKLIELFHTESSPFDEHESASSLSLTPN